MQDTIIKMKITRRQLRRILKEEVAYHSTDPANVPRIQQDGLLTGQESAHTTGGAWADEWYGTRPIYISMQKGKYEGQPLALDVSGLEVVADLPGLIDTGAMIEEEGLYWEEGYEPQELEGLIDENGMIYFEDLVDPSHPASQVAIELTGTAAVLENIPPDRIHLIESKKMKITKTQLRKLIKEAIGDGFEEMKSGIEDRYGRTDRPPESISISSAPTGKVDVDWDFDTDDEGWNYLPYEEQAAQEGLDVPIEIPEDVMGEYHDIAGEYGDEQARSLIDDWLSDETGWLHQGWSWV